MARFAELSESELSAILEEKVQKTPTRQLIKVTLNIFRGYLQEKGLGKAELLTSKLQKLNSRMHVCQIKLYSF